MTDKQMEIKRLYESGVRNIGIAKIMKLTISQVNRIIYHELGIQSKTKKLKLDEIREVREMKDKGMTHLEVSEALCVPYHRIKYILEAS